jgi:hypothetical protein
MKKHSQQCKVCKKSFWKPELKTKTCSKECFSKLVTNNRKGIIFSKETKEKMRMAKVGKKRNPLLSPYRHSLEMRHKLSLLKRGDKSRFWEGGITSIIRIVRRSFRYRVWREAIYNRDHFTCVMCKEGDKYLNADHIVQFSYLIRKNNIKTLEQAEACDELWDLSNGRTLCIDCHKKTDTYLNKGKVNLQKYNVI